MQRYKNSKELLLNEMEENSQPIISYTRVPTNKTENKQDKEEHNKEIDGYGKIPTTRICPDS
jgi:hypothetical protein